MQPKNKEMEKEPFNIKRLTDEKVRIEIDGDIGGFDWDTWEYKNTGRDIRKQLKTLSETGAKEMEVLITSYGGYVNDALQIHDALKEHPAKVTTIVQGFCASAATIIACAGDTRLISPNALYLIHKCRFSMRNANEDTLKEALEEQRTTNETLLGIYRGVLKKSEKELNDLFESNHGEGKWITAQEAVDFGFATAIQEFPEKKQPATAMARLLNHAREIFNPGATPTIQQKNNQKPKDMKKILTTFAALGALLAFKEDAEYDEKEGLQLSTEQLQKIEDTLKELDTLKADASKTTGELKDAKEKLSKAEASATEKDSMIKTLTAERDNWKSKYEAMPAQTEEPKGPDNAKTQGTVQDYVKNSPFYKAVAEEEGFEL